MTLSLAKSNSLLIIAGEESSCKYAIKVMTYLKKNKTDLDFWGIGNKEMEGLGFSRLAKSEDLAVMGLFEILKNQKKIRAAFSEVLKQCEIRKPKVALLLDYGGFNLKLAGVLKSKGIKVVYYIPPKIWVWRKNRVFKIKKFVDKVLVVHPFEVDFYKNYGVEATYVGHPLLEEFYHYKSNSSSLEPFKKKLGLDSSLNLGLMPGSRDSEVERLLNLFLDTAALVYEKKPNINVTVLVAPGYEIEDFKARLNKNYEFPIHFVKEDSWKMIDLCDYLITASGTATLQVGLLKKPQIVVYRMNPLSAFLAKIIVTGIKYFGLINLILNEQICPEYFQQNAKPEPMSQNILDLIINKDNLKTEMLAKYDRLEEQLKGPGAAKMVSESILSFL